MQRMAEIFRRPAAWVVTGCVLIILVSTGIMLVRRGSSDQPTTPVGVAAAPDKTDAAIPPLNPKDLGAIPWDGAASTLLGQPLLQRLTATPGTTVTCSRFDEETGPDLDTAQFFPGTDLPADMTPGKIAVYRGQAAAQDYIDSLDSSFKPMHKLTTPAGSLTNYQQIIDADLTQVNVVFGDMTVQGKRYVVVIYSPSKQVGEAARNTTELATLEYAQEAAFHTMAGG